MRREKNCGFLLLEVIPALLLITVVLLISTRMAMIRAGMEDSIRRHEAAAEAFARVWDNWRITGGRVAIVSRDAEGLVQLLDFPDETWLPDRGADVAKATSIWRRRIVTDTSGESFWNIECRLPGASRWQWWTRIRMDSGSRRG